ncbi:MAG: cysteine desulfuration protein SufE [Alphaproteobacteria bacterium]|nr:MAG: cysteine desulfuration protein SufE [Caulobacteraceae bacterium]TPW01123.1 MAG: cysteine desulfuration protein SufE [Alphaproteobacteria bacterium]
MTQSIESAIADLEDELALFPDWEERFSYLIDLGRQMAPLAEAERNEATKVRGCASQVWLVPERRDGRLFFRGESDAFLVKGLIAVLLRVYSGRTPEEILSLDPKTLAARLGLSDALTAQRSNGLFSMMQRIRETAAQPFT